MSVGGTHPRAHAMASACLHEGVDLRYNAPVTAITSSNGRATGIRLKDGRQIEAKIVVSNADPRTTFMELIGWDKLSLFRKERLGNRAFGPGDVPGTPPLAPPP